MVEHGFITCIVILFFLLISLFDELLPSPSTRGFAEQYKIRSSLLSEIEKSTCIFLIYYFVVLFFFVAIYNFFKVCS